MSNDSSTKVVAEEVSETDDAKAQADFDAGAAMETGGPKATPSQNGQQPRDDAGRFVSSDDDGATSAKVDEEKTGEDKPEASKATGETDKKSVEPKPKYVHLTEEQFARLTKAADRTDEFEKQFSKVFGTVGDMQKIVRTLQSQTPRGIAVKIPPNAFDAIKKSFPELAPDFQATMETVLKGIEGTGGAEAEIDVSAFEAKVEERVLKLAAEDLADEFPDWQKIVGAVDTRKGEKADPNNPFRKWLATKPQDYQDRINSTKSAGVITRAIRMFKSETKAQIQPPAKPNKMAEQRVSRIQEAVRPKSDGGQPPAKTADDDFEAGFKTG